MSGADLVSLFAAELRRCALRRGETVAVLAEPATRPAYAEAATAAVDVLGAHPVNIAVGGRGPGVAAPEKGMGGGVPTLKDGHPVLAALEPALRGFDLILDLLPEMVVHLPMRERLLAAGTRILTVVEPPDVLERLDPPDGIKGSVLALAGRLTDADALRVTSDAGTDIRFDLTGCRGLGQYGFADEAGRWDHWGSALVAAYPVDGSASGTVVLTPGDQVFPFKRYVGSETTISVDQGVITEVDEATLDGFLISEYLAAWGSDDVYHTSHIGLGMLPRARWSALSFYDRVETTGMDGRSIEGNFLFSTGPDRTVGRLTEVHLDIAMNGCTVELDGDRVVGRGTALAPEYLSVTDDSSGSGRGERVTASESEGN